MADELATTNMGLGPTDGSAVPGNPYLQNIIDLSTRDLVNNYNRTVTPAQNAAAVRSGSFGNTALAENAAADQYGLNTSVGDLASKLRFNDYTNTRDFNEGQRQFNVGTDQWNQNFGRTLFNDAYGQNVNNLQLGMGLIGGLGGTNATDLNNANAQQNTPLNYWQQFMNAGNATGGGGGTQTGTQGTTSNPLGAALGGAQLGSSLYGWGKNQGWWGGSTTMPDTSSNVGTNYLPSGYDALGMPNAQ